MGKLSTCAARHEPKFRYQSQAGAIRAALRSSKKRGVALRTYKCPSCKGWHLTSKPSFDIRNEEAS